jgi:hypothetical protein
LWTGKEGVGNSGLSLVSWQVTFKFQVFTTVTRSHDKKRGYMYHLTIYNISSDHEMHLVAHRNVLE